MIKTQNLQSALDIKLLLEGCLTGQKRYQEQLYYSYAPTMFAICLRYASDYHSAEDILQEGFIKVFNKIDKYSGTGTFEGWMKRIFINTAIEIYRKNTTNRSVDLNEDYQKGISPKALENLLKDDLIKLIQSLPNGYRNVFNLYVIDGYNHSEIAELLNISEGTSKSQLARARKTLKTKINDLNEPRQ